MKNLNHYKPFIEFILDKKIATGNHCVNEPSGELGLKKVFKDFDIFVDKKGILGDHIRYTTISETKREKCNHISAGTFINDKAMFWALSKGYYVSYGIIPGEWKSVVEKEDGSKLEFTSTNFYDSIFEAFNYIFMIETISIKDAVSLMEKLEEEAIEYGFSELQVLPLEYYVELFTSGQINDLKDILKQETDPIREEFLLWTFSKLNVKV